jgi:sugar lactone lactonase YvrE
MLYIADSESSAIRAIDLIDGVTMTIAGGDPLNPANLFAFGDRDGQGVAAKLQHPLGIAWHRQQQLLAIADSYNHKIKILDPASEAVRTLEPVFIDAPNCFKEPAGLAVSPDGSNLYIADTNNHLIRIMDLESGEVRNLNLNERTIS